LIVSTPSSVLSRARTFALTNEYVLMGRRIMFA